MCAQKAVFLRYNPLLSVCTAWRLMIHACLVAFCSAVSLQDQGQVAGEYTLSVGCKPGGRHALRYVPCGRQPATTAHPPQCIAPGTWCPGSKPYWKCPNEVSCPSACAGLAGPGMCTGLLQTGYSCGPTPLPCSAHPAVSRTDTRAVAGLLHRVSRFVPQLGAANTRHPAVPLAFDILIAEFCGEACCNSKWDVCYDSTPNDGQPLSCDACCPPSECLICMAL